MATGRRPATMRMYHVTNVSTSAISRHAFVTIGGDKHAISVATKEPDWSEVRLCVPNDRYYDGDLCGLPVACFSTTLWDGGLPTFSPYPRNAASGTEHWRVSVPFYPDDYDIYKMHEVHGQVQLLCLQKPANPHLCGPDILLITRFQQSRYWREKLLTQKDLETYFPGGNPNEYRNGKLFVNVHFVKPVTLSDKTAEWTPILTKHDDEYCMHVMDQTTEYLRDDWIAKIKY